MRYTIGYNEKTSEFLISDSFQDGLLKINLFPFILIEEDKSIQKFQSFLSELSEVKLSSEDIIVDSYELLNLDIRETLNRRIEIGNDQYAQINSLITVFIRHFLNKSFKKQTFISPPIGEVTRWEPKLYGRYGNVELRVIENLLLDKNRLFEEYSNIAGNISDEVYIYRSATRKHWLSTSDANFNLRQLMTNAGFYFSMNLKNECLSFWLEEYLASIADSSYLFPYPGCYPNFFIAQAYLFKQQGKLKKYIGFPKTVDFYQTLAGQEVLFLTPFYAEINNLYQTRKLFNLYSDISIPEYSLTTLPAYISTYPNRPHDSWLQTFRSMTDEIDRLFTKQSFTLFFASCGCYGMPLCRYVFKRYGCTSVYYGNHINTLFGIRQACSEDFMAGRRLTENWARGNLDKFKNVSKIDSGRYVL
jgi:hypothetical protein